MATQPDIQQSGHQMANTIRNPDTLGPDFERQVIYHPKTGQPDPSSTLRTGHGPVPERWLHWAKIHQAQVSICKEICRVETWKSIYVKELLFRKFIKFKKLWKRCYES